MSDANLRFCQENMSVYEDIVASIIGQCPTSGIYVDLGAHIGQHTAAMVQRGDVRKVIAVEAIPDLCDKLSNRFKAISKVSIIRAAVGQKTSEATFSIAKNAPGYSGLVQRSIVAVTEWVNISVPVYILDELLESKESYEVGFIKLDLEGGEFYALLGSKSILNRSRPLIVFENGLRESARDYKYSVDEFFEFFDSIDYVVVDFFGNVVNRRYWDSVLQTYMFVAYPKNSEIEKWCSTKLIVLVDDVVARATYNLSNG